LVGNLALQLSKLSGGMPVIGVDMYDYRLDVAKKCGADEVLNPTEGRLEGCCDEDYGGERR
jgi:threonine dehydrogenase-like Zn-dependent dehydrogenase